MPHLVTQLSDFTIHHRADLDLLVVRWWAEYRSLPVLQQEHAALLAALASHPTSRVLLDVRRHQLPHVEPAAWIVEQWFPQAVA
ncbi:hypothetical protein GCM10027048_32240 [Hymenobacter coalescens]